MWKVQEENKTSTRFVKKQGDYKHKGYTSKRYFFHKNGFHREPLNRKRHIKVQGSCKTGSFCPAAIIANIYDTGVLSCA